MNNNHNNINGPPGASNINGELDQEIIREAQERLLPIANVGRIMKQILPAKAKISKEAKETMQECVSEFISFVTAEASDKCRKERRKTVNGDDVCWALQALGFDDYAVPLRRYLHNYREMEEDRANEEKARNNNNNNSNNLRLNIDHDLQELAGRHRSEVEDGTDE